MPVASAAPPAGGVRFCRAPRIPPLGPCGRRGARCRDRGEAAPPRPHKTHRAWQAAFPHGERTPRSVAREALSRLPVPGLRLGGYRRRGSRVGREVVPCRPRKRTRRPEGRALHVRRACTEPSRAGFPRDPENPLLTQMNYELPAYFRGGAFVAHELATKLVRGREARRRALAAMGELQRHEPHVTRERDAALDGDSRLGYVPRKEGVELVSIGQRIRVAARPAFGDLVQEMGERPVDLVAIAVGERDGGGTASGTIGAAEVVSRDHRDARMRPCTAYHQPDSLGAGSKRREPPNHTHIVEVLERRVPRPPGTRRAGLRLLTLLHAASFVQGRKADFGTSRWVFTSCASRSRRSAVRNFS